MKKRDMTYIIRRTVFVLKAPQFSILFDWHTYAALLLFCQMRKLSFQMRELRGMHLYTHFTYIKQTRILRHFFSLSRLWRVLSLSLLFMKRELIEAEPLLYNIRIAIVSTYEISAYRLPPVSSNVIFFMEMQVLDKKSTAHEMWACAFPR